ncbi:phosphoribosyltransferase domain-containing protein [Rheinheimera sp.]|uniref:phosphoribosyltransferase domain-containing protein n=1 Tax=Rheinheimera sp. TaxID=1869214 RepID=UPI0040474963
MVFPLKKHVDLNRGRLEVSVSNSDIAPDDLFGFAERRNPKRAFLFVSKVLGRHIPVRPSVMQKAYSMLAAKIPADIPGPVLLIGMAETAVGLGAGIHRAYQKLRDDSLYIVSTRHQLDKPIFCTFEEDHSHATSHLIYLPEDSEALYRLKHAKSVVLIDDEASTGNTFINLMGALESSGLNVEQIVTVTLTDWSNGAVRAGLSKPVTSVSLLEGAYSFLENKDAPFPQMPRVNSVSKGLWPIDVQRDWGRFGVINHSDTLMLDIEPIAGEKVLVVGTNEFVFRPFLLAERLEKAGVEVYFSSTTRSPIAIAHSIKSALVFRDNYGMGIPNFLYNVLDKDFDRIIICTETVRDSIDKNLISVLNAEVLCDE